MTLPCSSVLCLMFFTPPGSQSNIGFWSFSESNQLVEEAGGSGASGREPGTA